MKCRSGPCPRSLAPPIARSFSRPWAAPTETINKSIKLTSGHRAGIARSRRGIFGQQCQNISIASPATGTSARGSRYPIQVIDAIIDQPLDLLRGRPAATANNVFFSVCIAVVHRNKFLVLSYCHAQASLPLNTRHFGGLKAAAYRFAAHSRRRGPCPRSLAPPIARSLSRPWAAPTENINKSLMLRGPACGLL